MSDVPAPGEIDWSMFGKTRPLDLDDLRRFSSADLDPYTVQLGQRLCHRFTFSPHGHRNLSSALSALAEGQGFRGNFEIGFGSQHVVHTTLKSDSGFLLTAITAALAEYYHEDFVVDFFKLLARESNVPVELVPIELQWRRMVNVLYGVLATSPFGVLLANFENVCPAGLQTASPETILDALDSMSKLTRHTGNPVELSVRADIVWIASAARWLYDLKIIIQSQALDEIYRSPGVQNPRDADLILRCSGPSARAVAVSQAGFDHIRSEARIGDVIRGGRVAFDNLFRSCFRDAFSDLDENLLAAYLSCAAHILQESLLGTGTDSRTIFLAQTSTTPGLLEHGLIETITAWFPELQRLVHRLRHYKRLSYDESRKVFDEKVHQLQKQCICATCRCDNSTSMEICKITLVEVIVSLGLNIARMVVSPRLYPKRDGVIAFYKQHHAMREARSKDNLPSPSEEFVKTFVESMPLPVEILEMGFLLFAHSNLNADSNVMGMTHAGLTIFLNGRGEQHDALGAKSKHFVGVTVATGSLCLYGHEARLELWDKGVTDLGIEQAWESLRVDARETRQIMKWRGEDMLCSFVRKDSEEEQRQAKEDGWWVL